MNKMAELFIKKYNLSNSTDFQYECKRKSLFSLPADQNPDFEFYQIAFLKGKNRNMFLNDLKILFNRKNRLIVEVLQPQKKSDNEASDNAWTPNSQFLDSIISPLENAVTNGVMCSKHLLLDFSELDRLIIPNIDDIYKNDRLIMDNTLTNDFPNGFDDMYNDLLKEASMAGITINHWFEDIWLFYTDSENKYRCDQIW